MNITCDFRVHFCLCETRSGVSGRSAIPLQNLCICVLGMRAQPTPSEQAPPLILPAVAFSRYVRTQQTLARLPFCGRAARSKP